MKRARKKLDDFLATPHEIVLRIQKEMQAMEPDRKIWQKDVAVAFGFDENVLTTMKNRGSTSIPIFAVKWCLENGLDVAKFVSRQ